MMASGFDFQRECKVHGMTTWRQKPSGGVYCKICDRESLRKYNKSEKGRESNRKRCSKYDVTEKGRESQRKRDRKYDKSDKGRERTSKYCTSEKGLEAYRIINAERRANKSKATPPWAKKCPITTAIVSETCRLQIETGLKHHLDHVIPLKPPIIAIDGEWLPRPLKQRPRGVSENRVTRQVQGLHVHLNCRPLEGRENQSKLNSFCPDEAAAAQMTWLRERGLAR